MKITEGSNPIPSIVVLSFYKDLLLCFVFVRGLYSYHEISPWSVLIFNIDIFARKKP
jgi:hypothetical protein